MAEEDKLGKTYRGQKFVPVRTPGQVVADQELQAEHDAPDAVPLSTYFAQRGIINLVMQASMRAYTKVQKAAPADWDEIFKDH